MDPNFDEQCFHPSHNFLRKSEAGYDEYASFSQADSCPSLSSSFLSIDTHHLDFENGRRLSIDPTSPEDYTASSASGTSPITPLGMVPVNTVYRNDNWANLQNQNAWATDCTDTSALWVAPEETALNSIINSCAQNGSILDLQQGYFCPGRPKSAIDPPLSRAVFQNIVPAQRQQSADDVLPWMSPSVHLYPQTIEPNATFHSILPSSPVRYEPLTPMKHHRGSSSFFASSPLTGSSSSMLPSQWDVEYTKYSDSPSFEDHDDENSFVQDVQFHDLSRSTSVKSRTPSPQKSIHGKSGLNCEAIIPQNTYACGVPGCVDKDGRPKRFKRQEHRKRHEKTVHGHGQETVHQYRCWVVTGNKVCGRNFSRRDNLKSHWKKTHGRKSNNQRNAYVATLDEDSRYYDEGWTGPLTADGLPIGHPKWPGIK